MSSTETTHIPVMSRNVGSWQFKIERQTLTTESLAAEYDRAAPGWTQITDKYGYATSYRKLFKQFFETLANDRNVQPLRVLDIGVGAGAFSLALADTCPVEIQLTAVDISSAMLLETATRLAERGVDATLRQADARSLPFDSASFDLVIGAHVFEHMPNPVIALAEIERVLRPGGWLLSCMTRRSWLGTYIQTKWRTHRVSRDRTVDWLTAAGLDAVPHTLQPNGICRLTSLVAIGRKPVGSILHTEYQQ